MHISLDLALQSAMDGRAVFILGAGFSYMARNAAGTHPPLGDELAKIMAAELGLSVVPTLPRVATLFRRQRGEVRLAELLREQYLIRDFDPCYRVFARLSSFAFYTTNYDNLLELIFEGQYSHSTTASEIRSADKRHLIMHLNGAIADLKDNNIPDSLRLDDFSYRRPDGNGEQWQIYLRDELTAAEAVFVIGHGMSADLDLERIVASDSARDKTFIIQHYNLSKGDLAYLQNYGEVLEMGVENFCKDLAAYSPKTSIRPAPLKSFRPIKPAPVTDRVSDSRLYSFLLKGIDDPQVYFRPVDGGFKDLINRTLLNRVATNLRNGRSVIVHSALGNGKSVFVEQLVRLCPDLDFYRLNSSSDLHEDIKKFCAESGRHRVIVIEPASSYLPVLRRFINQPHADLTFVLVFRTGMYDTLFNRVEDVVDELDLSMQDSVLLDVLDRHELTELDSILSSHGFYGGTLKGRKKQRISYLREHCHGRLSDILLRLFQSSQIMSRYREIIRSIRENERCSKALLLHFISTLLSLELSLEDSAQILDCPDLRRLLRQNPDTCEFFDLHRDRPLPGSSIAARAMITDKESFNGAEVYNFLIELMQDLDRIVCGRFNEPTIFRFAEAMRVLIRHSSLTFLLGRVDDQKVLKFYEQIRELGCFRNHALFWLQYAIACTNIKHFDLAEKYLSNAYERAENLEGFDTYQIDNQQARFMLLREMSCPSSARPYTVFEDAHRLLMAGSENSNRYYRYRVAALYPEFYRQLGSRFSKAEVARFAQSCRYMLNSVEIYLRDAQLVEREDVEQCRTKLRLLLSNLKASGERI